MQVHDVRDPVPGQHVGAQVAACAPGSQDDHRRPRCATTTYLQELELVVLAETGGHASPVLEYSEGVLTDDMEINTNSLNQAVFTLRLRQNPGAHARNETGVRPDCELASLHVPLIFYSNNVQ